MWKWIGNKLSEEIKSFAVLYYISTLSENKQASLEYLLSLPGFAFTADEIKPIIERVTGRKDIVSKIAEAVYNSKNTGENDIVKLFRD